MGQGRARRSEMPTVQRQAWRRYLLTLPSYGSGLVLLYVGVWLRLFTAAQAHAVALAIVIGALAFGVLIRSGLTLRWRDPLVVLPQVMFAVWVVALAYHLIEVSRAVALLWLALIVVYDMSRLPLRQMVLVIAWATALQIANIWLICWPQPRGNDLINELLSLGCMALLLPTLAMVSNQARALMARRKQQNQDMSDTLETLHYLSLHDTLTGLYNRRHMQGLLEQEMRRIARYRRPFCVAILDIDFFKRINDQHGHAVGDAVLKSFAQIVASVFGGAIDASARWGGEEFLVLVPESRSASVFARLEALRQAVHDHDWSVLQDGLHVSFSAGLAEFDGQGTLDQLVDRADQALYEAKRAGRDRIMPVVAVDAAVRAALPKVVYEEAVPVGGRSYPVAAAHADIDGGSDRASVPGAPRKPKRGWRRFMSWVLTDDPVVAIRMRMVLVSAAMYLFWLVAVIVYALPRHLLPDWLNVIVLVHLFIGAFAPPVLIRSGWSQRWQDPAMLVAQNLWANLMLVSAYVFAPVGTNALLAVLCQVQVFGFVAFSARQARDSGYAVIAMLVVAWGVNASLGGPNFDPSMEGMRIVTTCVVLYLLTIQSYRFSLIREKTRKERRNLQSAIEEVKRLTTVDALTGLFNRQHLHEVLDHESQRHGKHGLGLDLVLIDLDHFKQINDTYGHQVGDEVLSAFAQIARESFRQTDTVGRWGGEEFLIVMPQGGAHCG